MNSAKRLIVVSNRLPVTICSGTNGVQVQPSPGGLVSALLAVFRDTGGHWIGWPGVDHDSAIAEVLRSECAPDYSLEPVFLSAEEKALFYQGCANEVIWPLFHDLQTRCRFDSSFWSKYRAVNAKYADVLQGVAEDSDFVWVHDYHLMLVASVLRIRGFRNSISYFHHIPFPSPDIFEKLPWRNEILEGLLNFDTIGFQTDRDRRNFIACVRRELPDVCVRANRGRYDVSTGNLGTHVGTFPIGIDFKAFSSAAAQEPVRRLADEIRHKCEHRKIVLGVDRLDYTKGIPERLLGFATLLKRHPELRKHITYVQVVVPSREEIQNYAELRACIERRISEINGEFGSPDWCPITYMYKSVPNDELVALYSAADVMLVTPLKDGMNLVAKEYCATKNDDSGVLVLSEFAGAAAELGGGALLVNPYDSDGISSALLAALRMEPAAREFRMRRMRHVVRTNDVFNWCKTFRNAATDIAATPVSVRTSEVQGFATAV